MNIEYFVARFEEAEESSKDAREEALTARRYYDGNQLTAAEMAAIRDAGQMPRVFNRVRRKVDWLLGLELQSRVDPKAMARTPNAEADASSATDALRYVSDAADWDKKRSGAWLDVLIGGLSAVEVITRLDKKGKPKIEVNQYRNDVIFHDPYSAEPDFSDSIYYGAVIWSDTEALALQYPDKRDIIESSCNHSFGATGEFDDKPAWRVWADVKRKRVRQVVMHYREGDLWKWVRFVRSGILDQGESPYRDDEGESVCAMQLVSGYVDSENQRYGVVRDMFGPQDEINLRRRKGVALLSERQTIGMKGAVASVARMKAELRKPNGHVEIEPEAYEAAAEKGVKPFEILNTNDMAMGNLQMLQEAKGEIDQMGANSGLAGKDSGSGQSGRAIMARQQGGLIEIAPLTERMSDLTRRVFRLLWIAIRQTWTEEKWIRVTDDEKTVRFVGFNRPVTMQQRIEEAVKADPSKLPAVKQFLAQNGIMGPQDPRMQQVVKVENNVAEMDVDILIEEAPDMVTLEAETYQAILGLAGADRTGQIPFEVFVEMAPNLKREVKDKLLEQMAARQQGQAASGQKQEALADQQHQLKSQSEAAKAAKDMSQARKNDIETAERQIALNYQRVYTDVPI